MSASGSAPRAASSKLGSLFRYLARASSPAQPPAAQPAPALTPLLPSSPSSPPDSSSLLSSRLIAALSSLLPSLPSLSLPSLDSLTRSAFEKETASHFSPYDDVVATVQRRTHTLDPDEAAYIARRTAHVLPHLRRLCPSPSLSPSSAPSIGVCLSGGGYRAMLGSLSALSTLNDLGVLPSSTYVSGLSGSTWAMSQLYSLPPPPPSSPTTPSPPIDFIPILARVQEQVALPILSRPTIDTLLPVIRRSLLDKLHFSAQSLTMTDVLAWFICLRILSTIPSHPTPPSPSPPSSATPSAFPPSTSSLASLTLSGQRAALTHPSLPFPLYTAISSPAQVQWEFSPYSVGSWELGAFIPTWAFNRPFTGGASTSALPREPHLSTLLSVFSSAHCSDLASQLSEMAMQMKGTEKVKEGVRELVERMKREWRLQDVHPFEAIAFNSPLHSLPPTSFPPLPTSITSPPSISLMDAGLSFNFPLVPLLQPHRALDVVVLVDFTSPPEAMNGLYLHTVKSYCRAHGLPLPEWEEGVQPLGGLEVNEEESAAKRDIREGEGMRGSSAEVDALYRACHSRVTVFKGRGEVPTVVYVPLLSNAAFDAGFCPRESFLQGGFTATLNLVYSKEQSQQLMGLVAQNIRDSEDAIVGAISDKWQQKQQRLTSQE